MKYIVDDLINLISDLLNWIGDISSEFIDVTNEHDQQVCQLQYSAYVEWP